MPRRYAGRQREGGTEGGRSSTPASGGGLCFGDVVRGFRVRLPPTRAWCGVHGPWVRLPSSCGCGAGAVLCGPPSAFGAAFFSAICGACALAAFAAGDDGTASFFAEAGAFFGVGADLTWRSAVRGGEGGSSCSFFDGTRARPLFRGPAPSELDCFGAMLRSGRGRGSCAFFGCLCLSTAHTVRVRTVYQRAGKRGAPVPVPEVRAGGCTMVHRAPPVPPVPCSGTLGNSVSLHVKHSSTSMKSPMSIREERSIGEFDQKGALFDRRVTLQSKGAAL